jgi:hypothetical protein
MISGDTPSNRLALTVFGGCALALWLMLYPYIGIRHDALFYTMQGLAHAHPDLYRDDIYLRFGSQDRYSIFGTLDAAAIQAFGVDHAAQILTLASILALTLATWVLARCVMPPRLALLAAVLVPFVNQTYGAGNIFHVIESFVTPRPYAEALVLLAAAALLAERTLPAVLLLAVAAALHPIMAGAGFGLLFWLRIVRSHPRAAVTVASTTAALLITAACWLPSLHMRIDDDWLTFIRSVAPYLELRHYSYNDWNRLIVPAATAITGSLLLPPGRLRQLLVASLAITAIGFVLAAITSDWLHLRYFMQAQFWRCQWLLNIVATLSLPVLVLQCWHSRQLPGTALLLLLAAYCFEDLPCCPLVAALAACTAIVVARPIGTAGEWHRTLYIGAAGVLIIGVVWNLANGLLSLRIPFKQFSGPTFAAALHALAEGCLVVPLVLLLCWWLSVRRALSWALPVTSVVGAAACLAILPSTVEAWTRVSYPAPLVDQFDGWRRLIPVGDEVLFAGSPLNAWIYLQRPSYISGPQRASGIFSRQAAMLLGERLRQYDLDEHLDGSGDLKIEPAMTLDRLCARSSVAFIVTRHDLDQPPLDTLPAEVGRAFRGLKLYQCLRKDSP